jgi:hypothetical protein
MPSSHPLGRSLSRIAVTGRTPPHPAAAEALDGLRSHAPFRKKHEPTATPIGSVFNPLESLQRGKRLLRASKRGSCLLGSQDLFD